MYYNNIKTVWNFFKSGPGSLSERSPIHPMLYLYLLINDSAEAREINDCKLQRSSRA